MPDDTRTRGIGINLSQKHVRFVLLFFRRKFSVLTQFAGRMRGTEIYTVFFLAAAGEHFHTFLVFLPIFAYRKSERVMKFLPRICSEAWGLHPTAAAWCQAGSCRSPHCLRPRSPSIGSSCLQEDHILDTLPNKRALIKYCSPKFGKEHPLKWSSNL